MKWVDYETCPILPLHNLVMSILYAWNLKPWLEAEFSTNGVESIESWCELEFGCI